MGDRYLENFASTEQVALELVARYREDYAEVGMYACAGGWVVWVDRTTQGVWR